MKYRKQNLIIKFFHSFKNKLYELISYIENNPKNADIDIKISSSFHTLKGGAAFLGLNKEASILHQIEEMLFFIQNNYEDLNLRLRIYENLLNALLSNNLTWSYDFYEITGFSEKEEKFNKFGKKNKMNKQNKEIKKLTGLIEDMEHKIQQNNSLLGKKSQKYWEKLIKL
ncbi:MAG: Hpt domain-containing protein [Candidatus Muiribacteriota bacterium]